MPVIGIEPQMHDQGPAKLYQQQSFPSSQTGELKFVEGVYKQYDHLVSNIVRLTLVLVYLKRRQ